MICRAIEHWLWTSRAVEELPRAVQRHLGECVRCRRRRELLARMDEAVSGLPLPPSDPQMRRMLWTRLDQYRTLPVSSQRQQARSWRWTWTAIGIAACLLVALGAWLGWFPPNGGHGTPLVDEPKAHVTAEKAATTEDGQLICKVLGHNVRLAEASTSRDRIDALCSLAMSLKDEVLERTHHGGTLGLPLLASLFTQVVNHGIVRLATSAREGGSAGVAPVIQELRSADRQVREAAVQAPPVVADVLRSLADASRAAADQLASEAGEPLSGAIPRPPDAAPFLATLIHYALKLADERDSLERAALCSQLAEDLAPVIVLLSAANDSETIDALGVALGNLLDRGVAGNLERAINEDTEGRRRDAIASVRQQAVSARPILERNLAQVPAKAQPGLKRAIEASGRGHERVSHPGKPKARPGSGKPDKGDPLPETAKPKDKPAAPPEGSRKPGGQVSHTRVLLFECQARQPGPLAMVDCPGEQRRDADRLVASS